jgi:hypothetical protein
MFRVVDTEARKQAESRTRSAATKALIERGSRRQAQHQRQAAPGHSGSNIPASQQPDVLALRLLWSRRLLFSIWGTMFGGTILAFRFPGAGGDFNLGVVVGVGVVLTLLSLMLYGNNCPRCRTTLFRWWASPLPELFGEFHCRSCGLRPSAK